MSSEEETSDLPQEVRDAYRDDLSGVNGREALLAAVDDLIKRRVQERLAA